MKTKVILAIVLLILLISCGQPTMEDTKTEQETGVIPPPPEVEPPASSPYEHAENGQTTG